MRRRDTQSREDLFNEWAFFSSVDNCLCLETSPKRYTLCSRSSLWPLGARRARLAKRLLALAGCLNKGENSPQARP
jgi:hypothetical protein